MRVLPECGGYEGTGTSGVTDRPVGSAELTSPVNVAAKMLET